jgi:hypothetical protein
MHAAPVNGTTDFCANQLLLGSVRSSCASSIFPEGAAFSRRATPQNPCPKHLFADTNRFIGRSVQYHQSVDKLLLYVFGPLVFAAALLIIATGIRQAITKFRSRPTPEQLRATYEAYLHRLLNPQPNAVERELGKLLPERLLQLYEDSSAIQEAGFQLEKLGKRTWRSKPWQVYCFEPLDVESLNELPYEEDLGPGFCFATTGRGSWYWIAASDERAKDSPILFLDYEGGGSHGAVVAHSLDEFLKMPRLPAQ